MTALGKWNLTLWLVVAFSAGELIGYHGALHAITRNCPGVMP